MQHFVVEAIAVQNTVSAALRSAFIILYLVVLDNMGACLTIWQRLLHEGDLCDIV